jgi:hypothetical protein
MKRLFESRLAPAIAVALIGVIAVAGVAIAGSATSSKKKKKGLTAAKVSAIADHRIAAAAPNLAVKSAGTAGSLRMFGHVSSSGGLSDGSGIGAVTFAIDRYCFSGLAASPRGGNATVDFADAGNGHAQLGLGTSSDCPAGTQAYVVVIDNSGNFTDGGFFVEFWS